MNLLHDLGVEARFQQLAAFHPWGAAAIAITRHRSRHRSRHRNSPRSILTLVRSHRLLKQWVRRQQLCNSDLEELATLPDGLFSSCDDLDQPPPLHDRWVAHILGHSWQDWQTHALMQHLPWPVSSEPIAWIEGLPGQTSSTTSPGVGATRPDHTIPSVVLNLQSITSINQGGKLSTLSRCWVVDPSPARVKVWRRLGVRAHWIHSDTPIQNPLPVEAAAEAGYSLGLPPPAALAAANSPEQIPLLCLGTGGSLWEHQLDHSCWCLPEFHKQALRSADQARLMATWLQACQLAGIQLIELQHTPNPSPINGFAALGMPDPAPAAWLPPLRLHGEISLSELQAELAWRRQGCPPPPELNTPQPTPICLWEQQRQEPTAAVCISLHNYAERIEAALESVRLQTLETLELIVVDDASSDDGASRIQNWLNLHGQRFARVALLQHCTNSGLAAARNTAFHAAKAPWCFVLDADNQLLPTAVERCLSIANNATANTAVVHPLIALHYEEPDPQARALVSGQSWRRELFTRGNYVDAMALVRRSAWQHVNGYTHIPGGWEDFDFWCKLIDAGFHGLLCPQRLAIYTVHHGSMAATNTRRMERTLSRLLQHRHPWLRLPLATETSSFKEINPV